MQRLSRTVSALAIVAVTVSMQTAAAARQPPIDWKPRALRGAQPNSPFDHRRKAPLRGFIVITWADVTARA